MNWRNPPPLSVISGKLDYFRRREAKIAVSKAEKLGRTIIKVDAQDEPSVTDAITSPSMFGPSLSSLVLVENPEKLTGADLLLAHHRSGESDVAVILLFEGDVPEKDHFKSLLNALPKSARIRFDEPKPWEREKIASKFCVAEAKAHGFTMSSHVADLLIFLTGVDYGVLSFEVLKLSVFVGSQGRYEIEVGDLGKVVSPILARENFSIADALKLKNAKAVLRSADLLAQTSRDDPTMDVCRMLGAQVSIWIRACEMKSSGYTDDDAAARLGMKTFPFQKNFLPVTKVWTTSDLVDLLMSISQVERGVKSGCVSPWIELNTVLYRFCVN